MTNTVTVIDVLPVNRLTKSMRLYMNALPDNFDEALELVRRYWDHDRLKCRGGAICDASGEVLENMPIKSPIAVGVAADLHGELKVIEAEDAAGAAA